MKINLDALGIGTSGKVTSGLTKNKKQITPTSQKRNRVTGPVNVPFASTPSSSPIVLISCSQAKVATTTPIPARDLYWPSALFRGAVKWAERRNLPWFVLSAKYGLLAPDALVTSYDETLPAGSSVEAKARRKTWAEGILQQLWERDLTRGGEVFEIYAGPRYTDPLVSMLSESGFVADRLKGLSALQRMHWFSHMLGGDRPLRMR